MTATRITALALSFAALAAACGGPDASELATGSDELGSGSWAFVRRDVRKCAAPMCGGYFVSPVQNATLRCADGKSRATCYVASLDLTALGLEADGLDAGLPATGAGGEKLLVRGRANANATGGVFTVTDAFQASKAAPATTSFYVVHTTATGVSYDKINDSAKKTAKAFRVSASAGDAAAQAKATAEAASKAGLVASGSVSTIAGKTTFTASAVFLHVEAAPAAPAACGAGEKQALEQATAGLLYTSESDYPFTAFVRADLGGRVPDATTVRALAGASLPANAAIRTQTVDEFFQWIARAETADMDPYEKTSTAQYRALRSLLEKDLKDIRIFRAGEIQVQVYILGRTACGELAGLSTISIET